MPALNQAHVIDHLGDPLREIEADGVSVPNPGATELRLSRDRDRWTVNRHAGRSELMPSRILNTKLVRHRTPARRDALSGSRVHSIGEVRGPIRRRQATANVRGRVVLEAEIPDRE